MNEPIISPWLILLIEKIGDVDVLFNIAGAAFLFATVISICDYLSYSLTEKEHQKKKRVMKYSLICLAISVAGCVIIPSRTTCYKMLAASYVTPANIEATTDKTVELIDKISSAIEKGRKQ